MGYSDIIVKIISIILNIPNFVNIYDKYVSKYKLLFIPGEFSLINQSYVNDFLLNNENLIFKIQTDFFPKEPFCYLILTDINYLLLVPCKLSNLKHWATIFYVGLIFEIETLKKIGTNNNIITFKIITKNYSKYKPFEYNIVSNLDIYNDINKCINERKNKIHDNISLIIPNYIKIKHFKIDKFTMESMKNLVNTIKKSYKEQKENNIFEANALTELCTFMYELLIENNEKEAANYFKIKISKFDK